MELDMATVETRRYRKSDVNKRVEECNSNRDFIKGPTTSFEYNEDEEFDRLFNNITFNSETDEMFGDITGENFFNEFEEQGKFKEEERFANVFHSTTFKFKEDEEFDRLFIYTSQEFREDVKFDEMLTTAGGCITNKFEEQVNMFTKPKF